MSIIVAWPSVDIVEANDTAGVWKAQGYATAVLVETKEEKQPNIDTIIYEPEWAGFPTAANKLCQSLASNFDIVVIGGNDLFPVTTKTAQELEKEFKEHFKGTLGLMHPTGDRYGSIDIVSVCPWIGAQYIKTMYGGYGPYYSGYYHYFCDAELQDVAVKNNLFWQRPDLSQFHDHWGRNGSSRPEHLMAANTRHTADKATYEHRKQHNFPGSGGPR